MGQCVKENAHLKQTPEQKEKYENNYDRIFGSSKCSNRDCEYWHISRLNKCSKLENIATCELLNEK